MRNEFEKQVSDKMEELKFVPSQPVWDKIEEQIRHKKDRRRMILWVPVVAVLVAGGIWWMNGAAGIEKNISVVPAENSKSVQNNDLLQPLSDQNQVDKENKIQSSAPVRNSENASTVSENGNNEMAAPLKNGVVIKNKLWKKNPSLTVKPVSTAEDQIVNKHNRGIKKENHQHTIISTNTIRASATPDDLNPDDKKMTAAPNELQGEGNEYRRQAIQYNSSPRIYNLNQPASIQPQNQSLFIGTELPKAPAIVKSKWRFGLSGDFGISGEANGLHIFQKDANPDFMGPNALPPVVYPAKESPVENSLSFAIGFVAKREISKRLYFSTGLDYNFYSTKIKVGNKINAQNYVGSSFGGPLASARQSTSYDYYNKFHFISLPVSLEYQLFRKFPLHLHGGISVQQLVSTNALVYDYSKMMYNKDENAVDKTNIFTNIGLDYAVLNKKHTLLVGPELRYSLTSYEKDNKDSHLFSVGLRAQFLFKK